MALPIDQLSKPVTKAQAKAALYDMLTKAGVPVNSWASGAVLRVVLWIVAAVIAGFSQVLAVVVKGLFLDTATGVWLTYLARYVYGVTRRTQTFAPGAMTFNNAGGGEYPFEAGECVVLNPTTKKTYVNTEAFTVQPLQTGLEIAFQAVEAGSGSTSPSGTITQLATPLLGVSVTNAGAFVGTDEQTDEELREDCRDAMGALSPFGPRDAYKYFAKHVPGGDPITRADGTTIDVNRTQVVTNPATGEVTVYVATASGEVTGDIGTPGSDLYIIHENLQANAVGECITETTASATNVFVGLGYAAIADADAGYTPDELKTKISSALTAFQATYPIAGQRVLAGGQGYLFVNRLRSVILGVDGIVSVTMAVLNDVALNDGQIFSLAVSSGSTVTLVEQQ